MLILKLKFLKLKTILKLKLKYRSTFKYFIVF